MARRAAFKVLCILTLVSSAFGQSAPRSPDWHEELARPDPAFSQMPFWFWNDELDDREIARQMAEFRSHGVYGFVIHARMGLPKTVPYMGRRWLGHVRFAVEEAARTGMRVCLYDEGMYPSGSAHGEVVRSNPAFAAQGLTVQSKDITGPTEIQVTAPPEGKHVATILVKRRDNRDGIELGTGQITVIPGQRGTAFQLSTVQVPEGRWRLVTFLAVPSRGHIRGVHPGEEGGQPGAPPAADLLNPQAMQAFLRFAYEPYYATLKEHFGKTVIGMFTDEPSLLGRGARGRLQPWTDGLAEYFQKRRGYELVPLLPALLFDIGPKTRQIREDFALTLAERLDETYYQPLSRWCQEHGVALTGHPAGSDEILPLRHFQLPGQDMVWRWVLPGKPSALEGPDSTVAKCSSSVARHDRRPRNANEIYGAYGWHLTMDEMKWLADWLMVRGVNLLYPHAFYYSIRQQRYAERPPDLGMHNAWWPHYRQFADYTSRVCKLMSGDQVCDVAVLAVGNHLPTRAAKWLYENQIDFNYLEDWRLVEQAKIEGDKLQAGPMTYRVLIVDQEQPLPRPLDRPIKTFAQGGGKVRVCQGTPSAGLVAGLERDIQLNPHSHDLRYAHVVKHGIHFYLLVNEGEQEIRTTLACRCRGQAEWFDPWTGRFAPAAAHAIGSGLEVPLCLPRRESLVLAVDPSRTPQVTGAGRGPAATPTTLPIAGPWKIVDAQGKPLGERLGDWRQLAGLERFAGTLCYRTAFELSKQSGARYRLDLGVVGDWAVVRVNGQPLGPRFWAPMTWDVTEAVRQGRNEAVVEVTNSMANRYDPKNGRPSGLFGPVDLRMQPGR